MLCSRGYVDMGPCVGHMAVMLYVLYELWGYASLSCMQIDQVTASKTLIMR